MQSKLSAEGGILVGNPKNNGRKTDGTFAPGNALEGKTKGARHKATMAVEELLGGQVEQVDPEGCGGRPRRRYDGYAAMP